MESTETALYRHTKEDLETYAEPRVEANDGEDLGEVENILHSSSKMSFLEKMCCCPILRVGVTGLKQVISCYYY